MIEIKYLKDVLTASINSCKAEPMILKENGKDYSVRSQLHALIVKPFGTGKTTQLIDVPNSHYLTSFTSPSLVGTITKDGVFVDGAIKATSGKTLIADEYQNLTSNARAAMLSLLEHQRYSRAMGYKILMKPAAVHKKFYSVKFQDNGFDVSSRFSCVCCGIWINKNDYQDLAWLSRFLCVNYSVSIDDIYRLTRGENSMKIDTVEWKETPYFEDYLKFNKRHEEIVKELPFVKTMKQSDIGFIGRNVLDIARLACFNSLGRGSVVDWEKALEYVPISLYFQICSQLSLIELRILELTKAGFEKSAILAEVQCSEKHYYETINKLENIGLLKVKLE